jgi:hypothetical protein
MRRRSLLPDVALRDGGMYRRLFVYETWTRGIEFSEARELGRGILLPVYVICYSPGSRSITLLPPACRQGGCKEGRTHDRFII